MPNFKPVTITTTVANQEQAEQIAQIVLKQKLVACVQYEHIVSQYVWQDEICCDNEVRVVMKTARHHYAAIEKIIRQHHSYECPQIIMQAIARGSREYLRWLKQSVG